MALGLFSKAKTADSNSSNDEKFHSKDRDYDPEMIGAGTNRLADPAQRDVERGVDSSSESSIIGKQLAMEADNAIQYRTCSWQKVRPSSRSDLAHH